MNKLIVVVMGENCERFIDMCLDYVKNADAIVYCDGGSAYRFWQSWESNTFGNGWMSRIKVIENKYDQEDKAMNGKQRNFYLDYVKKTFPDYWCLCLDADEIVEDLNSIKELINRSPPAVYSVKMRHLIGDLGHEDSTQEVHYVPNRLFKISEVENYPEVEHPVLKQKDGVQLIGTDCTTIWHLAYIPNMWEIKKRYDNHLKKSNMHSPEFLKSWYYQHLFGQYPKKQIDLKDLPVQLLNKFGIDKDEFYFAERGIDIKHPLMVKQWADYFGLSDQDRALTNINESEVLDLGCGRGPYLYFWRWYTEDSMGIELSQWAVDHAFVNGIVKGDISRIEYKDFYLITAIDVLEHLDDEELHFTLQNMALHGRRFLFSIPFIGDPNLENDKTHKQFKTKEEWVKLIESHGIKIIETPKDWAFAHQILIGEKNA